MSTDRQETECQRPEVEQLARVRGFEVVKVFEEKMSAAKVRPEYAKMELTNNEVESGLRTWVLARKTWLFVGHETSARRAADALTILTTCKRMGIDPRAYLRDTLARLLAGEKSLVALLPENYAAERAAAAAPLAA